MRAAAPGHGKKGPCPGAKLRGARDGFSLIEILMAVGLTGTAVLAVAGAIDGCARRVLQGRELLVAGRLADAKFRTVLLAPRVEDEAGAGRFEDHPGFSWTVEVDELAFELGSLVLDPRTRRVRVVVEGGGGSGRVEAVGRLAPGSVLPPLGSPP